MPRKLPAATKGELIEEAAAEAVTGQTELLDGEAIYPAILNAMRDVEAIVKIKQGSVSYKFRSIDDVMNALHPVLVKHGIFVVPFIDTVKNVTYEQDRFGAGAQSNVVVGKRNLFQTILTCYYRFYAIDGSYVECKVAAESSDYSDKATQQALSYCFKIALLQTFCIPTEDVTDGDERQPDMSGKPVQGKAQAQSKLQGVPKLADRPPVQDIGKPVAQAAPPPQQAPPPEQAPPVETAQPAAQPEEKGDRPDANSITFLELVTPTAWQTLESKLMPFGLDEEGFKNWAVASLLSNNIELPKPSIWWLEKVHGRTLYMIAAESANVGQLLHKNSEGFTL